MQHQKFILLSFIYAGWLPVSILDKSEFGCVTDRNYVNQFEATENSRQRRLVSFNSEEGSLKIELNFAIPFIQIPIGGRSSTSVADNKEDSQHSLIDINTRSLVTAGAFVFAVLFVVPKILRHILPYSTRYAKVSDSNTEIGRLLHDIEMATSAMNIDADSCWRKTVCSTIQTSSKKLTSSRGTSWDKIIDGLARNDLLHSMIHGSSTFEGIMSGLKDERCALAYKSCNLNMKDIISLIRKLSS